MQIRQFVVILFAVIALHAQADSYWVVGSFTNQLKAQSEMARVEAGLGADGAILLKSFDIDGSKYFRLLAPIGIPGATTKSDLQALGLEPWLLRLTSESEAGVAETGVEVKAATSTAASNVTVEPAKVESAHLPASNDQGRYYYVVVGAYADISEALDVESTLQKKFDKVRGAAVLSDGKVMHRVMVGPMPKPQLDSVRSALALEGIKDSWLLETEASPENFAIENAGLRRPILSQEMKQDRDAVAAPAKKTGASNRQYPVDFNLAKMPPRRTGLPIPDS